MVTFVVLKNAASRTMKWCLGCNPPGHKMETQSCCSVKTTPSTSSSKSQRYEPVLILHGSYLINFACFLKAHHAGNSVSEVSTNANYFI